jgi:hypothetical protein
VTVIPRIVHPRFKGADKRAFGRGESARPLRIFVDGETVPDSPELDVLLTFAHHRDVEVLGSDARFRNLFRVGSYDATHAFTPWEMEFEGGRRVTSVVPGRTLPKSVVDMPRRERRRAPSVRW